MVKLSPAQLEPWQDANAKPYIFLKGASKNFDGVTAVGNVTISIYREEFFPCWGIWLWQNNPFAPIGRA